MSMQATDTSTNVGKLRSLYPTYALRAWLTALLAQTQKAQTEMQAGILTREAEIEHLRRQIDNSAGVVKSLESAIERVDDALRRQRDVMPPDDEPFEKDRDEPADPEQISAQDQAAAKKK